MTTQEQLEKEQAKYVRLQEKTKKDKEAERQQKKKISRMKKNVRTHQLCERGGMLNLLLVRPDDLTDDQVKDFLKEIFMLPDVQKKLTAMLPPDAVEEALKDEEMTEDDEETLG